MAILSAFSLEEWQVEQIDDSFPDDDEFYQPPYNGQDGLMVGQIRKGNGCLYAVVGFMPHRYADKIIKLVRDFEKRWLWKCYRHMWE